MPKNTKRYSGPALPRQSYMREFLVECPKCKKEALVLVVNPYYLSNGKLLCHNCHYSEKTANLIRFNAIVKRNCDNCGNHFEKIIPNNNKKTASLTIPCPHCGVTRTFRPRNEEYRVMYENNSPGDPVFNFTLWFQCQIRGNLFWAYNRKHLNEIKDYVSSSLRDRQTSSFTTMVEKLPGFIKEAKNRKIMLKEIDRLLAK